MVALIMSVWSAASMEKSSSTDNIIRTTFKYKFLVWFVHNYYQTFVQKAALLDWSDSSWLSDEDQSRTFHLGKALIWKRCVWFCIWCKFINILTNFGRFHLSRACQQRHNIPYTEPLSQENELTYEHWEACCYLLASLVSTSMHTSLLLGSLRVCLLFFQLSNNCCQKYVSWCFTALKHRIELCFTPLNYCTLLCPI